MADPRAILASGRTALTGLLSLLLVAALAACGTDERTTPVNILATSASPVVVADGASSDVTMSDGTTVSIGVVRIGDNVTLDVRESGRPTAGADVPSGKTVAIGGHTVRVTAQPKATDYDPATVAFAVVDGPSDVTPAVPVATGSPGTPTTLAKTTQAPVMLGDQQAIISVVNPGKNALVIGFRLGQGVSGVHHLVSGDLTTIGSHVVKVESDGSTVTVTPYI